ncbi:Small ubiquitin-related modifier 3 [Holothuria leucospilota]|uniref:Small ubiquitin-related modifier 3 n=1 Tax=Holothuria leucospilota TaxID=206669 RepID=A0A9Q1BK77_HOLLE|nr:Small ubiquitin-related modifier 3 [Holothuria leucospilota]
MAEQKKDVKDESEHITLRVVGGEGSAVQFKIKKSTPLRKLMRAYCEKQVHFAHGKGGALNTLRFRYDGENIDDNDTPEALHMDDMDQIEVFQQQTGGY